MSTPGCPRCGSPEWVSVSLDGGYTRRAQCVPCGAYHRPIIGPGWKSARFSDPEAEHPDYRERLTGNDNRAAWHTGNAAEEGDTHRGWLLGHFMDPGDHVRKTEALEVKWGVHPAGQQRHEWTTGEDRTALLLMVRGRFRLDLSVGSVVLEREGDYVAWGPGIEHTWQAVEDSVTVTIRWPSIPT